MVIYLQLAQITEETLRCNQIMVTYLQLIWVYNYSSHIGAHVKCALWRTQTSSFRHLAVLARLHLTLCDLLQTCRDVSIHRRQLQWLPMWSTRPDNKTPSITVYAILKNYWCCYHTLKALQGFWKLRNKGCLSKQSSHSIQIMVWFLFHLHKEKKKTTCLYQRFNPHQMIYKAEILTAQPLAPQCYVTLIFWPFSHPLLNAMWGWDSDHSATCSSMLWEAEILTAQPLTPQC